MHGFVLNQIKNFICAKVERVRFQKTLDNLFRIVVHVISAAAAAKSLQSCPILCNPTDSMTYTPKRSKQLKCPSTDVG